MPKFPRANPDVSVEKTQKKESGKAIHPSKVNFIEFNGEKLYPQIIQFQNNKGEAKSSIVFSAIKPAGEVSVPPFKVNLKKMHWYYLEGQIVLSEGQPKNAIKVDELRKNITKLVVNSYLRSKPNAGEVEAINAMVVKVVKSMGLEVSKDMDGLAPELMQSMSKNLFKEWESQMRTGIRPEAIEAAQQVVRFDSVWKAIKSSCVIYPNDFVVLNRSYNDLKGKDGGAVNNKDIEDFLKSFKTLLGGASISRKVLFSKEFTNAMQLHLSDPDHSMILFSALKRDKAYSPAKLCEDYVDRMQAKDYAEAKSKKVEVAIDVQPESKKTGTQEEELEKVAKTIAKAIIKSSWRKPTKDEIETIKNLAPLFKGIMDNLGEDVNSVTPGLLQYAAKNLLEKFNPKEGLTEADMDRATKVIDFNIVWKTIKSSCAVYPDDYIELYKRYNKLSEEQAKKGNPLEKKSVEEFFRSFKGALGGTSISRKVLFSTGFTEAMKLHLNDPESSQKLLENLKRSKAYNHEELCKAYISCMRNIEDYREFMPVSEKGRAARDIDQFIINAGSHIKAHEINIKELNQLRDFLIPDSAFITFPKKMYTAEFAEKFAEKFPTLYKVFGDIVTKQNPKEFARVEGDAAATKRLLDKKIQNLVGEFSSKLQSEEKKNEAKILKSQAKVEKGEAVVEPPKLKKFNLYREFKLLESASRKDLNTEPKAQAQAQEQEVSAVVIHAKTPEGGEPEKPKAQQKDLQPQTHVVKNLLVGMKLIKDIKEPTRREDLDVGEKGEPEKKEGLLRRAANKLHLKGSGKPHMVADRKAPNVAKFDPSAGKGSGVER